MYILIVAIHAAFVLTSHLLGYRLLEGLFIVFGIFFLFYFSPLFFIDEKEKKKESQKNFSFTGALSQFSPKDSLLIPVMLLYIALYGFILSIFGSKYDIFLLHSIIVISIYLIIIGYIFSFHWKHEVFFEIFRFHILFSFLGTIIFTFSLFFESMTISFIHSFIGSISVIAGTFLLSYTKKESPVFLSGYLMTLYTTVYLFFIWIFPDNEILSLLTIGTILSLLLFEVFPRNKIFHPYTSFFQYFSLFIILLLLPILFFIIFQNVQATAVFLLLSLVIFFISIHTRYTNYIVFILAIFSIYFLYSILFLGLIINPTITSFTLFIFFLPILIIGTSFFWEEKHEYDFMILHYSSIVFSLIYCIYIIFFIGWGEDLLFIISLCIFGLALLFFLSYFRFRTNKNISH